MRLRQEVINVVLAQLLEQRGLAAMPEQIVRAVLHDQTAMPDVIIDFHDLGNTWQGVSESVCQGKG